ncbi:MAG: (2Fe-2S)-binding protein [Rhodospirillales bacterium]
MNGGPRIVRDVRRSEPVSFTFDGSRIEAHAGESVAAALMAAGVLSFRTAPVDGGNRGVFCAMGVCQECIVEAGGQRVESCRLEVREGLVLRRVTYG